MSTASFPAYVVKNLSRVYKLLPTLKAEIDKSEPDLSHPDWKVYEALKAVVVTYIGWAANRSNWPETLSAQDRNFLLSSSAYEAVMSDVARHVGC
jgi:hypothetical protein